MPDVLDITPISRPSESRTGQLGRVGGAWAHSLWDSQAPTHQVAVHEDISYVAEEREVQWTLERGETGWTATDLMTGIFGFGADPNEAIVDLIHALREHRDVLERQDRLSPDLEQQLAYLRRS